MEKMNNSVDFGGNNGTEPEFFILMGFSTQPWVRMSLALAFLFLYLITVFGNCLIFFLITMDSHLHTPMYFFLGNLSLLDICYSSCTIPQMLAHSFTGRPIISYGKCFAQMSITLFLAVTECFLLAVMAYDRFVAICSPLHYMLIMSRKVYVCLAVFSWTAALMLSVVPCFTLKFHLCGRNVINHFMCEVLAIIKLECSDTSGKVNLSSGTSAFTLLMPFAFILVTYGRIGLAVMRIKSVKGRSRALSTCGSHLAVVGIFYGSSLAMYMRPQTKSFSDQDKLGAVFYMVITPVLNPLIYSLRNKDVKGALWRVMGRKTLS
ncbi:olfactory receptor 13H1-like [Tiliqua scincoides]|uniref:olfactory receptor 13H1-like n=1 Tax=Tiliqua scincoides TaxID=71010 RepID=UPI0034617F5F